MMETDDERLARYFASLEREGRYEVEAVLKESPNETTQLVRLPGDSGISRGLLVRKLIKRESGLGSAYERLYQAQLQGQRFKFVPFIWECYANDEHLVVVMERVVGESLDAYVACKGASMALARDVFPRLCDAASELHEELDPPLIHRDLKPSNIVLSECGLAIIDFGIARDYRDGARSDTMRFGTCSFAPPEQFGFGQTTVRSDVFALGAILFFCLTGVVPDTYVAQEDLVNAGVSSALGIVIARATALDQAGRYASARELKQAFLSAVDGEDAGVQSALSPVAQPALEDAVTDARQGGEPGSRRRGGADVPLGGGAAARQHEESGAWQRAASDVPQREGPDARQFRESSASQHVDARAQQHKMDDEALRRSPEVGRFSLLGKVWNALLIVLMVLFAAACVGAFISPSEQMSRYPVWVNALGFLFFMPLLAASGLWMLVDKRRLARRFPRLRRYRFWHWIALFAIVFVIVIIGLGVSGILSGVPA